MKTIKYLTMAALALMMIASCTNDDYELITKQPVQADGITITAQLAPKSALTRAVADNSDGKITVTWAVDEHIAVLYGSNKKADARITTVDEGVATISFTVDDGTTDNTDCTLIYPATAAKDDNSGVKTYAELLSSQDGTLNANLDVRVGSAKIQVTDPGLTDITQPEAQYSIFKFTLTTDETTAINAKGFVVRDGSDNLITSVTPASATSSFYVAIPDKASGSAFKFIASDGTKKYTKSISTTAAIAAGNYYQTPLNMGDGVALPETNLSGITVDYTATDFETLTGTLGANVNISVAAGATITLDGANINGDGTMTSSVSDHHAGLLCLGDATIILNGDNNKVKAFSAGSPGILVPSGSTLTIQGPGSLTAGGKGVGGAGIGASSASLGCGNIRIEGGTITATGGTSAAGIGGSAYENCGDITITGGTITASSGSQGCGIGSGPAKSCGDITISGGTITATGGTNASGIGSSNSGHCGNILINGGTVTATATGTYGPGIGCGPHSSSCRSITITSDVNSVTATKAPSYAPNSIGAGGNSTGCGPITIGGIVYWDGTAYQNGGDTYLQTSPLYAHIPYGAVSGKFTINNSGGQVYFSKGNLKYSNGTWSFHTNQYDMCFTSAGDVSANYDASGTFDLFGYGTSGYNSKYPYLTGMYDEYYQGNIAGTEYDWGSNAISNGGNTANSGWRTLTQSEWSYLLNSRSTTSGVRYAKATVNGVAGLIILPDDWSTSYFDLSSVANDDSKLFSTIQFDQSVWENTFEAHGAVFLPVFRYREGSTIIDIEGYYSYYWSSTYQGYDSGPDAYCAFYLTIEEYMYSSYLYNSVSTSTYGPIYAGAFVRLVKDAN